jgi:hypothetical protein
MGSKTDKKLTHVKVEFATAAATKRAAERDKMSQQVDPKDERIGDRARGNEANKARAKEGKGRVGWNEVCGWGGGEGEVGDDGVWRSRWVAASADKRTLDEVEQRLMTAGHALSLESQAK